MKAPKTLWGKKAMGVKTRKQNKYSNKFILRRDVTAAVTLTNYNPTIKICQEV